MTELQIDLYSDALGKSVPVRMLYPHRRDPSETPYKVLYLLHGLGDNCTFWERRTGLENYLENKGIAAVMPDGDISWYCDMAKGSRYFTFITEELPQQIRGIFRDLSDRREDTFIGGASMGGYGAFKAAMSCPERYAKAFSFSGAVDIPALGPWIDRGLMENAMGPLEEAVQTENSLYVLAKTLKESGKTPPELFMWCGYDDFLYRANIKFRDHVNSLGLPLTYREGEGEHQWICWDRETGQVIDGFLLK